MRPAPKMTVCLAWVMETCSVLGALRSEKATKAWMNRQAPMKGFAQALKYLQSALFEAGSGAWSQCFEWWFL